MAKSYKRQSMLMRRFSTLAGPITKLDDSKNYKVKFKSLTEDDYPLYRAWAYFLVYGATASVLCIAFILFQPSHWIVNQNPNSPTHFENWLMLGCLAALQTFLITVTFSSTRATLRAKNPEPVAPPRNLKVAFVTTRAPGEPVDMVINTLEAIKRVNYSHGKVDAWLLDETNDPVLKAVCDRLQVNHFSRKRIEKWNAKKTLFARTKHAAAWIRWALSLGTFKAPAKFKKYNAFFAAKTKHGNFNAWLECILAQGFNYDILAGVDTDHVPEPNYLQRQLGYFRDPNVAFVVGPQVYGNYQQGLKGLVVRWAESQASFFQSTIQRAGNSTMTPMFVGTNYTIRMSALMQIGGFQPCITEDMATGLSIHAKRNPATGSRWKSVYTPDVLAVGAGPSSWAPYFTQQWRWAAGTFDTWRRMVWKRFYRLSPGAMVHYFLMLTFYPITALTWLIGLISSLTYLTTGATAILAPWNEFISLYMMSIVMQLSLYFWNRRFNVSPHEPQGTYGVPGMVLTTLTAPIYLSAFIGIALGKKPHFEVTSKGTTSNPDGFSTYRSHIKWAAIIILGLAYGIYHHHSNPAMDIWVATQLLICLVPIVLGMKLALPNRLSLRKVLNNKLIFKGEPSNA
jgi:cellulose synthase/poly-beta-1,6-N-acetylglucosamine synthase-like glycosyltransferase